VSSYFLQVYCYPGSPPRHGPAAWSRSGFRLTSDRFFQVVAERRTVLYNQVVTSYHKAKIERAGLARELEAAKGKIFFL
jgi:hypothetical protein